MHERAVIRRPAPRIGALAWVLGLPFGGCAAEDPAVPSDSAPPRSPLLTAATEACDPLRARWDFTAEADAWTGNGQVPLSTDGLYLEVHPLDSKAAAGDGSSDSLSTTLSVVADWRDVSLGSTTIFNCKEPGLAGILRIFEQDGKTEADCRYFGENPWEQWNLGYQCDTPLVEGS